MLGIRGAEQIPVRLSTTRQMAAPQQMACWLEPSWMTTSVVLMSTLMAKLVLLLAAERAMALLSNHATLRRRTRTL